jgi:hypothetical protein
VTDPDKGSDKTREERLRHNSSFDPENKTVDELNPMEADSWSGGSINPDAKKVARGEAPANRERGPGMPPESVPATPPSVTRPWSPEPTHGKDAKSSGVDSTGRPRGEETDAD